jgi:hypothetical protein
LTVNSLIMAAPVFSGGTFGMISLASSSVVTLLRIVLGILAFLTVYVGIDNALGGIATLGMQGPANFLDVTDQLAFAVRDSHVRFLGGVWLAAGLVLIGGALRLDSFRDAVLVVCGLAVIGGLARFSQEGSPVFTDTGLLIALGIELVVFPLLALAVWSWARPNG